MKSIRKIFSIFLLLCLCISFCSCEGADIDNVIRPEELTYTERDTQKDTHSIPKETTVGFEDVLQTEEITEAESTAADTTEHIHEFTEPTCISPKKCISCGEVDGDALGHKWIAATCESPKTCDRCNEITGNEPGHSWSSASCTQPKKCTVCGDTDGDPAGHIWKDATCTEPKICSVCSEISGSAKGHSYSGESCTSCGEKNPNYISSAEGEVWIPTRGGKKYHKTADCSGMIDPLYVTKDEAIRQGFDACKRCYKSNT